LPNPAISSYWPSSFNSLYRGKTFWNSKDRQFNTPGLYKKDPEQVRREAQNEVAFEAAMGPGRELHEKGKYAEDAVGTAALLQQLGQQTEPKPTKKAKEAEIFTCKLCNGKYTDGSRSGGGSKKNYGVCSSKCRDKNKTAKRKCEHGLWKSNCRDCGAGYCDHGGRKKSQCRDCGTGHCDHGLWKSNCKDCGTARCDHGRKKSQCKDCGTDTGKHGR
jgi:hypothetical protein